MAASDTGTPSETDEWENMADADTLAVPSFDTDAEAPEGRPKIFAIANQKGGVGKTTTTINLGTALAAVGHRVLIVDVDPQGNASTGLGIEPAAREISTYDVLLGEVPAEQAICGTEVPKLDIIPATVDLLGAELELTDMKRRNYRLRDALQAMPAHGKKRKSTEREKQITSQPYSYILIDCPPSLTLLTVNAMAAADAILVPLQCEFFALEGLSQLLKTVEQVRQSLNKQLVIQGVVLTMYDQRNKLSAQVEADVRDYLGDKVYRTMIPRNVRISEAPSYGRPALIYDYRCAGSQAYMKLASELIQQERQLRQSAA